MENPQAIVPFLRSLLAAKKSVVLYPPGSEMATTRVQQLRRSLDDFSARDRVFPIQVGRDRFVWPDGELVSTDPAIEALRLDLQAHGIAGFSINPGVEDWEIREFLEFLNQPVEKLPRVGGARAYLRERGVVHVRVAAPGGLGLPGDSGPLPTAQGVGAADDAGVSALLGARPGRHPVDLLVDAILDTVDERLTGLTYDRTGLLEWFQAISADGGLESLCAAAKMLVTMTEGHGDRETRVRTTLEALLLLPETTLKPLLTDWLMPRAATDLAVFNLLTQITEDELAEIGRHIPPEQLMTLASDLVELPWEKGKGQRLVQAITDTLQEGGEPAAPGPLLARDDPLMVELRQEMIDACHPDVLLERSADLLLALVMIEGGGEQPGFSIEALEEIVGEALGRGNLALAVRVLQGLGAIEEQAGDPTRERADRIANLRRKAADRANVAQVVGLLRQGSAVQQLDAIVGYLRLVPANAVNEFAALLADEPDRRTRVLMCEVLARLGPAVIPELVVLSGDKRWFVVRNVLYILGKIGHPSALASALAALDNPHPRVRVEAIRAASLIDGAGAAEPIGRRTHDPDPTVRSAAIAALSMPGHDAGIPPLRDVLLAGAKGPEDVDAKLEAIRALVTIGTALAHDTLTMIAGQPVRFWQRADRQVRDAAAAALTSREGKRGG